MDPDNAKGGRTLLSISDRPAINIPAPGNIRTTDIHKSRKIQNSERAKNNMFLKPLLAFSYLYKAFF